MNSLQIAVFSILFLFGIGYNELVAYLERKKVEGYTWHQVAGGVGVTLIGAMFLIGWQAALMVGLCMTASGAPMIVGAWVRHERLKRAMIERLKQATEPVKPNDKQA